MAAYGVAFGLDKFAFSFWPSFALGIGIGTLTAVAGLRRRPQARRRGRGMNTLLFFAPQNRIRISELASGSFTKLEYLILNHPLAR
jgi:hypothetical protein